MDGLTGARPRETHNWLLSRSHTEGLADRFAPLIKRLSNVEHGSLRNYPARTFVRLGGGEVGLLPRKSRDRVADPFMRPDNALKSQASCPIP